MIDGITPAVPLLPCDLAAPTDTGEDEAEVFSSLVASLLLPAAAAPPPAITVPDVETPATTAATPLPDPVHDIEPVLPPAAPRVQNPGHGAEPGLPDRVVHAPLPSAHDRPSPATPETLTATPPAQQARPATTPPAPLPSLERATRPVDVPAPILAAAPLLPHEVAAPVATPTAAPAAPAPQPVHEQVAVTVRHLAEGPDGTREVRLELHPQELGHVQVEVTVRHGRVEVTLRAEQPHAVAALTDSLPDLAQVLDEAGLDVRTLDLDPWTPPAQQHDPLPDRRPAPQPQRDADRDPRHHPDPDLNFDALL